MPFIEDLYHYTDTAGLLGIVQSGALRATNILFLNDRGELRYAIDLVQQLCAAQLAGLDGSTEQSRVALRRDFAHRVSHLAETGWFKEEMYVACFCRRDDLLSQWRAYGEAGGGFSIRFNRQALHDAAYKAWRFQTDLGWISYDASEHTNRFRDLFSRCEIGLLEDALPTLSQHEQDMHAESWADRLVKEFFQHAPFMKHQSFSVEEESRIVVRGPIRAEHLKFRAASVAPIPYIDIPLPSRIENQYPIASIRIGPRKEMRLAERALTLLFAGAPIEVQTSGITLR